MKIRIFKNFSDELKLIWQELEHQVHPFVFQRWEWMLHWQQTVGQANRTLPCIVVIYEEQPVVVLPLGISREKGIRILKPLGGDQNDYHVPLHTERGKQLLQFQENWTEIISHLPDFDVLRWEKILDDSVFEEFALVDRVIKQPLNYAYAAVLPSSWKEYQQVVPKKIRADSRRQRKRLTEKGVLEFKVVEQITEKEMEIFIAQKRERFFVTGVKDMLEAEAIRGFYKNMTQNLDSYAHIHFAVLKLDDIVLASHWGAFDENSFYYLMPTFNQEWNRYSPGRLLLENLIEWSIGKGLKVFDFTVGGEQYKKDWCNREMPLYELLHARTFKGKLYNKALQLKRKLKKINYLIKINRDFRKWYRDPSAGFKELKGKIKIPQKSSSLKNITLNSDVIRTIPNQTEKFLHNKLSSIPESSKRLVKPLIKNIIYQSTRIPGMEMLLKRWQGPCAIFCLHRVLPDELVEGDLSPNKNLTLSESSFSEMLAFLQQNYNMVSLDELVKHLHSDSKEMVICITFDDGYKDNLIYALPLLEEYKIPAIIYVTTRFLEGNCWMWWYELWDILLSQENISTEFHGEVINLDCKDFKKKISCYNRLHHKMMKLSNFGQNELLCSLTGNLERKSFSHLCLNWDDVYILDKHPLITIGTHSHSHPVFSKENKEKVKEDINKSKQILETRLKHEIKHFAYPYGTVNEVGKREYEIVKDYGFKSAVTTQCHQANNHNFFNLPRYGMTSSFQKNNLELRISGLSNLIGKQLVI